MGLDSKGSSCSRSILGLCWIKRKSREMKLLIGRRSKSSSRCGCSNWTILIGFKERSYSIFTMISVQATMRKRLNEKFKFNLKISKGSKLSMFRKQCLRLRRTTKNLINAKYASSGQTKTMIDCQAMTCQTTN
jgi:hypothetical protein